MLTNQVKGQKCFSMKAGKQSDINIKNAGRKSVSKIPKVSNFRIHGCSQEFI